LFHKKKQEKRSPLKQKPLRNPGESLDRQISEIYDEDIMPYVATILVVIIFAAFEWFRWLTKAPPEPLLVTLIAIAAIGYSIYGISRAIKRMRPLELGLEGEKTVGQELEHLRTHGCEVLHDIPGEGFNVDHVVVSTHGIFVIETKTISKSVRGNPTVQFDGERVLLDGFEPDRDPVKQALMNRDWVVRLLQGSTARRFPAKAVVLFPGWWVNQTKPSTRDDLFVLNPGQLGAVILREPETMKKEDVALACTGLSLHVRAHA
jgi:hypothetical protein